MSTLLSGPSRMLEDFGSKQGGSFVDLQAPNVLQQASSVGDLYIAPEKIARVVCFFTFRGTGKTAGMTTLAWILRELGKKQRRRIPIYSNYNVHFADDWHPLMAQRAAKFPQWVRGSKMLIDELGDVAPSKRTLNRKVVEGEQILRVLRKFHCEIITSAQFITEITGAWQRQIDYFVKPSIRRHFDYSNGRRKLVWASIRMRWWNWSGSVTGRPLNTGRYRLPFPPPDDTAQKTITYFNIANILQLYETDDVIVNVARKDYEAMVNKMQLVGEIENEEARLFEDASSVESHTFAERLKDRVWNGVYKGPDAAKQYIEERQEFGWRIIEDNGVTHVARS